jgi:sulfur carrier protein
LQLAGEWTITTETHSGITGQTKASPLANVLTGTAALEIILNGEPHETGAQTLAALCVALGVSEMKIATAVNNAFVPVGARERTILKPRDRVEIVAPRQGG